MASITVDVDVDLDSFDTEEIVRELIYRIKSNSRRKGALTDKQKDSIREEIKLIATVLDETPIPTFKRKSLDDVMKVEFLNTVWDKYTSFQLEKILA